MPKFEGAPIKNESVDNHQEAVGPSSDLERAQKQFKTEEKYKNKERSLLEKMINLKKVSREDIVAGYAEQLDDFITKETEGNKDRESEALAKWHILYSPAMAGSTYGYSINAKDFSDARDLWVQSTEGELSSEEINKWPEVQNQVRRNLEHKAQGYPYSIKDFISTRDQWVEAGVLTQEEANSLPRVQESARNEIQHKAQGYPYSIKDFISTRDQWVEAGVLTQEEANRLPEVRKSAELDIKRKAQGHPYNKTHLEESIANWVNANVVEESEARNWV